MSKLKFLVLNPSPNSIDKVLQKANAQHTKNGPFEGVLLLGDVIPKTSDALPQTELLVPTYFGEGQQGLSSSLTAGEGLTDVMLNLTLMGSLVNILKHSSGFTIMYISGRAELAENHEAVRQQIKVDLVDILVTYNWPHCIAKSEQLTLVGDKFIDEIVCQVKPRYHFSVGHDHGKFLEYPPFEWNGGHVTRFISLGQEGTGEKWFYAFGILETDEAPENLAGNPFLEAKRELVKRLLQDSTHDLPAPVKRAKVVGPESCFFCLSNPNVETHMIVAIGKHSYFTVAKGPLTLPNKDYNFSGHGIIVPIEHAPTIEPNSDTYKEIEKFQASLAKSFASTSHRLVFFEIGRKSNVHHHVQFLPVPTSLVDQFADALHDKASINNEKFPRNHPLEFRLYEDTSAIELEGDYIRFVTYHEDNRTTTHIAQLPDASRNIDLQFPRRVLAALLNLPKRVLWNKCRQSKFKETADCGEFKKFYREYDFTL